MSTNTNKSFSSVNGTQLAYRVRAEVASQGITMAIFSAACFGASQSFLSGLLCRLESGGCAIQPKGALLRNTHILSNFFKQLLPQRINAYQMVIKNQTPKSPTEHLVEENVVTSSLKRKVLELFCARVSMRPSALDVSILADVLNMEIELVRCYFADALISMRREVLNKRATTLFIDLQKEVTITPTQPKAAANNSHRDQAVQVGGSGRDDLLTQALLTSGLSDVVAGTYAPQPCRVVYLPTIVPLWVAPVPTKTKEQVGPVREVTPNKRLMQVNKLLTSFRSIKPRDFIPEHREITAMSPLKKIRRKRRVTNSRILRKPQTPTTASEARVELSSPTHDLFDLDVESLFSCDVETLLNDAAGVDLSEILLGSMTEINSQDADTDAEQDTAIKTILRSSLSNGI